MKRFVLFLLMAALMLIPASAWARDPDRIKAKYTKRELQIPVRDGARLFTSVYIPKDASPTNKYPIMLTRTPYSVGPYGEDKYKGDLGPSRKFEDSGYIFAHQDVRGAWMSEGEFVNMRPHNPNKAKPTDVDESSDTYDTIEWLLKNIEHHNGKVGQWGVSYPGFYTSTGMIDAHPALKASSPQAPISDWFVGDDFHHNGVLFLPHAFNFLSRFGHARPKPTNVRDFKFDHGTSDGYEFFLRMGPLGEADQKHLKGQIAFWNEMLSHESYDGYWKARNLRNHLKDIKPAVLTVGGWFDAENLFGALQTYKTVEARSPGAYNVLVMGPWSHGGWGRGEGQSLGNVQFGSKTSEFYREQIEFPFFESFLKGRDVDSKNNGKLDLPEAYVFQTGSNEWKTYETWPPKTAKPTTLFFSDRGQLAIDKAPEETNPSLGFDQYISDPRKPVPFLSHQDIGMAADYMVDDQRQAARRPDVLVYQTEPLAENLALGGPLKATLHVSTSGTDSDWVVKLIDVYPDNHPDSGSVKMGGYQQLIRGEPFRGKFREGYDKPKPFEPNEPTTIQFTLPDIHHSFQKGHRVMIQIQSSWFPLADRNPQTFVDIPKAKESDFQTATQRVYRVKNQASRLEALRLP